MDLKIIVIGRSGVGKTSLIKRYTEGTFSENIKMSVGADFGVKVLPLNETTNIRLKLWDIAGQELFFSMTRVFYQGAHACLIVFDRTDPDPFDAILKRKQDLDEKVRQEDGTPVPCMLLANKCDMSVRPVADTDIQKFVDDHGFIGWSEVSAKKDKNISQSILFLVRTTLQVRAKKDENQGEMMPGPERAFRLQDSAGGKDGCC